MFRTYEMQPGKYTCSICLWTLSTSSSQC